LKGDTSRTVAHQCPKHLQMLSCAVKAFLRNIRGRDLVSHCVLLIASVVRTLPRTPPLQVPVYDNINSNSSYNNTNSSYNNTNSSCNNTNSSYNNSNSSYNNTNSSFNNTISVVVIPSVCGSVGVAALVCLSLSSVFASARVVSNCQQQD
jgi:beta-lactamase regulating signal transducer with metallopeptidase domain